MLVLTRKQSESIVLIQNGRHIGEIQVNWIGSGQNGQGKIKVGLDMPEDIIILRKEIWEEMKNKAAAQVPAESANGKTGN